MFKGGLWAALGGGSFVFCVFLFCWGFLNKETLAWLQNPPINPEYQQHSHDLLMEQAEEVEPGVMEGCSHGLPWKCLPVLHSSEAERRAAEH